MNGMSLSRLPGSANHIALVDVAGSLTHGALDDLASRAAGALRDGALDLAEARVAFLIPPGRDYVAALLGTWRAGG